MDVGLAILIVAIMVLMGLVMRSRTRPITPILPGLLQSRWSFRTGWRLDGARLRRPTIVKQHPTGVSLAIHPGFLGKAAKGERTGNPPRSPAPAGRILDPLGYTVRGRFPFVETTALD